MKLWSIYMKFADEKPRELHISNSKGCQIPGVPGERAEV